MYNPTGPCSTLMYILMRVPILTVALGLVGASAFIRVEIAKQPNPTFQLVLESPAMKAKIGEASMSARDVKLADVSYEAFRAITKVESGTTLGSIENTRAYCSGSDVSAVHSDGVSYGPAGLTLNGLKQVMRSLPNCQKLGYDEALNDKASSTSFAYLFFLDQLHRFKSLDRAMVAYNYGPTRTMKRIKEKRNLPENYLGKVKKEMKKLK